jgi:hypothetical protein
VGKVWKLAVENSLKSTFNDESVAKIAHESTADNDNCILGHNQMLY